LETFLDRKEGSRVASGKWQRQGIGWSCQCRIILSTNTNDNRGVLVVPPTFVLRLDGTRTAVGRPGRDTNDVSCTDSITVNRQQRTNEVTQKLTKSSLLWCMISEYIGLLYR
jgi:hypothetical protein